MHFVYILRCADGALYVGETSDIDARLASHNDGRGARFTSLRRPVTVAYSEAYPTRAAALVRERQLKGWTRAKKEALVDGDLGRLKRL
jgi:predicted GIY-YIG superfamily endonuclease